MLDDDWLPIGIAVEKATARLVDTKGAQEGIIDWLAAGDLAATARSAQGFFEGKALDEQNWQVPKSFWQRISRSWSGDWSTGNFQASVLDDRYYDSRRHEPKDPRVTGVRISISQLDALIAQLPNRTSVLPSKGGGRPNAKWWPDFAEELTLYIADMGFPDGKGHDGQSKIIDDVFERLQARGKEEPSRSQVQPVINAILERWRSAGN